MSVFVDIEPVPMTASTGKVAGQNILNNTAEMQIGFGAQVFRADQQGIWLGAEQFTGAPFSVDMQGNLIASSATLGQYSKISIFKQDGIPTSTAVGDLWVDTNDSNKVYRSAAVGADQITSGEWEEVTVDALLRTGASQNFTGSINVLNSTVVIDGANGRILIDDGTDVRGVWGNT